MKNIKIGFIGAGNMASSLIRGLLANGYNSKNIWASNTNSKQLDQLKNLHIHTSADNRVVVKEVDIVVLSVKPQVLKEVVIEIADLIREKKPLLISIAVGVKLKTIQHYLKDSTTAIIRAMPNTPALLACGATGLFANANCSIAQKNAAETLFRCVGIVVRLNLEKELDIVAALSGSGPAYFFLFIYALQTAGVELGLSKETAALLSQQTALGAARMVIESDEPITKLKQNVTSRGGTTQAALEVLEKNHFCELIKTAMFAAKQRAETLADELENQSD
jgi:pyrroline-5-carboxylate reductase